MEKIINPNDNVYNTSIFGEWFNDTGLKSETHPFKHCILPNFLTENNYNKLKKDYPDKPDHTWWKYNNPLEVKYTNDDFNNYKDSFKEFFYCLSNDKVIDKIKKIFDIDHLEYDPIYTEQDYTCTLNMDV